jgi:photosystem II stability/assembly factor-like uncharacterized protein
MSLLLTVLMVAGCQQRQGTVAGLESEAAHPLAAFEEKNDDPVAAAADRYQRRLSSDGTVPDGALLKAKAQRDAMRGGIAGFGADGVWPVSWEWIGPGNIGGRLRPIVIHPTDPDIMYVGSASGGIWKTTSGGAAWFALDDFLPSLAVGDMVMHPEDPDTLYAGTGEGFFETVEGSSNTAAVRGAGIFVSTDAGSTWNHLPSTGNSDFWFVNRLAFDPLDPHTILAATNTGIWRSIDNGLTWSNRLAIHALDIQFDPNDPDRVVAGGHDELGGPAFSTDGGVTWQTATGAGGLRQEMAWAANAPNVVYTAVSDFSDRIKIWRSTDGGQNYTLQTTGSGIETWAGYNNTIWVDPTNASHLMVGGVYLYRTLDAGATFTRRFNSVHADMHRIVQHPAFDGVSNKTVYFATDGGIFRTTDVYGTASVSLNHNLGVTQFYGGAVNPDTGDIIGGTQDNGTLFYSGNPQAWNTVFGGDGGYGAADPTDPDYFYGEVQRAYLHRSANGGLSSSYIYGGPNPIEDAGGLNSNFIPYFTLDPNNASRMLVACRRLWRSNNVKAAQPDWYVIKDSIAPPPQGWNRRSPSRSHFDPNSPYNLSTVAIAEGDADRIWAGHNNGNLYFTSNGTDAAPVWTRVDNHGSGLPDRWISTIVIDRNNHDHVYVALMGWEPDNLWETTDSGNTWSDISGSGLTSIADAPISAIALHRSLPGWLFAGTDIGLFMSGDNGATWSTQAGDPGTVPVEQLLWKNDHTLLAVTHGRGMFLARECSIVPEASKLYDGVVLDGVLPDIYASDDQYLKFEPSPTTNLGKQIVELIVQAGSSAAVPEVFQFRIQSKMVGGPAGDVLQEVNLWNYQTGRYERVDLRPATTSDVTTLIEPGGDASRFVQAGTLEMTASIKWASPGFSGPPFTWSVDLDEAVWLIK